MADEDNANEESGQGQDTQNREDQGTSNSNLSFDDLLRENASLRASLSKVNEESAGRRVRIRELEKAAELKTTEVSTELEKVTQEWKRKYSELEQTVQTQRVAFTITSEASGMGFSDPSDASRFLETANFLELPEGESLQEAIKKALTELSTEKPYLLGTKKKADLEPDRRSKKEGEDNSEELRRRFGI